MKQGLSRNTCCKIVSNAFAKLRVVSVFVCDGKAQEVEKIVKLELG